MVSRTLRTGQVFTFITRDPNVLPWGTGVPAAVVLISLSDDYRAGERGIFSSFRFLLITPPPHPSPPHSPAQEPQWTPGSSNRKIHVNINTGKKARKTGARERFLLSSVQLGSLGKKHDQWSNAGSNSESQKPKMGWILHKRNLIQLTHTSWAWCGFLSIASRIRP